MKRFVHTDLRYKEFIQSRSSLPITKHMQSGRKKKTEAGTRIILLAYY
jgi:hypothetical protein